MICLVYCNIHILGVPGYIDVHDNPWVPRGHGEAGRQRAFAGLPNLGSAAVGGGGQPGRRPGTCTSFQIYYIYYIYSIFIYVTTRAIYIIQSYVCVCFNGYIYIDCVVYVHQAAIYMPLTV